jgi:hypothetical protein
VRRIPQLAVLIASFALSWAAAASAATLEQVGSFDRPIFVTSDPEDASRLFVVEREGRVMLADDSGVSLFADLESLVSCCLSERGLLSIALAPDFPTTERFYAAYTGTTDAGGTLGDIHVDSFRPGPGGGGELVREPILGLDLPNHHGGQLQFGPDGYLYVTIGDGGGAGDPLEEAQELETLNGKILRIDPHPGEDPPYTAPADNPFVGVAGADEIWAYGLRNPWRFSFDRNSDDMVVADVGQSLREEVDFAPSPAEGVVGGKGANYGWNCREGLIAYVNPADYCDGAGPFTDPVFDYPHDDPGGGQASGCSITGGYVVRDPKVLDLFGRYVYADFCVGVIRSLVLPDATGGRATDDRSENLSVAGPVSFGEDSSGRVYVVSNDGPVYRLAPGSASGLDRPAGQVTAAAAPVPPARSLRVRIYARWRRASKGINVTLTVRAEPCAGLGGATVRLSRGGRPAGTASLNPACVARFFRRIADRSTYRALLFAGGTVLRSPRLVVSAG